MRTYVSHPENQATQWIERSCRCARCPFSNTSTQQYNMENVSYRVGTINELYSCLSCDTKILNMVQHATWNSPMLMSVTHTLKATTTPASLLCYLEGTVLMGGNEFFHDTWIWTCFQEGTDKNSNCFINTSAPQQHKGDARG